MYRAEKIVLTEGIHTETFALADRNTRFAKGLYNAALFRLRQSFTGWDKADRTDNEKEVFAELAKLREAYPSLGVRRVLSYGVLEKLMRVTANPDFFAGLPMQTAQAVVKAAAGDFSNWLASLRAYKKDPSRFLGRPRMPRYCKNDKKSFTVTNQDAVLYPVYKDARGGRIEGRKRAGRNTEDGFVYAGMELKLPGTRSRLYLPHLPEDAALKEVKVCPYYRKYVLILVLEVKDPQKSENTPRIAPHMAGIDLGTDNIAAVVTTDLSSRVYKGGAVLSRNRLFHRDRARAVGSLTKGTKHKHAFSRHLDFLSEKHDGFVRDNMHKISADIIRFCAEHRVGTIVIGTNPLWKQRTDMGKANNQKFVSVPHADLRWMITYKARAAGMTVILQEESYTSKADVTSNDPIPVYGSPGAEGTVFSGRRISRGLYRCGDGAVINADCNGAANILRKAFPDAWDGTEDYSFLARPQPVTFQTLNRRRVAV